MTETSMLASCINGLYKKTFFWIHKTIAIFVALLFLGSVGDTYFYILLVLYLLILINLHIRFYSSSNNAYRESLSNFRSDENIIDKIAHTNTIAIIIHIIMQVTAGIIYYIIVKPHEVTSTEVLFIFILTNIVLYGSPVISKPFNWIKKIFKNLYNDYKIHSLYTEGDKLYKQERYFEAIEVYQEAVETSKELKLSIKLYSYYAIGMSHLGLEEYNQANDCFEKVMNNGKIYPKLYYAIAEAYSRLSDWNKVFCVLNKLSTKLDVSSNEYKKCQNLRGKYTKQRNELLKLQKEEKAKELYQTAIEHKNNGLYNDARNVLKGVLKLEPENKNYKTELNEIIKLYNAEKSKVKDLYNNIVNLKNERKFEEALENIKKAYEIAEKQKVLLQELNQLNTEINTTINDKDKAEILFSKSVNNKNNSEYTQAIKNLNQAISLNPEKEEYKNLLNEVQTLFDAEKAKMYELYAEVKSLKDEKQYQQALEKIKIVYQIAAKQNISTREFDSLNIELNLIAENIKKADDLYQQCIENKNIFKYGAAINTLNQAINLDQENEEYKNLLNAIQLLYDTEKAKMDDLYNQAVNLKNEQQYQQSADILRESYNIADQQGLDKTQLDVLNNELNNEFERLKKADELYKKGCNYTDSHKYKKAMNAFQEACDIAPEKEEYKKILDDTRKLYNDEKTRFHDLYNEAIQLKNEYNYPMSLEIIEKIYELANLQEFQTSDIDYLKAEVAAIYENNQKANALYNESIQYKNNNEYGKAIEIIQDALNVLSDNEVLKVSYSELLSELNNLYKKEEEKIVEICNQSEELKNKGEYQEALNILGEAFDIAQKQGFSDAELKHLQSDLNEIMQSAGKAEELYQEGINYKNDARFGKAVESLSEAVRLAPVKTEYKNLLNNVQQMLDAEKDRMNNLLKKAESLKDEGEYQSALDTLDDIYGIADKQNLPTVSVDDLNTEITNLFDNLKEAEEIYNTSIDLFNSKNYTDAIKGLEKTCELVPKSTKYKCKLAEAEQELEDIKKKAKDYYNDASQQYKHNEIPEALDSINNALNLIFEKSYQKLKNNILQKQKQIQDEQEAEEWYNNALKDFEQKSYTSALDSISEAVSLKPTIKKYKELKQRISAIIQEEKNTAKAIELYQSGMNAYNDADFSKAERALAQACKLKPDNEEWRNLLEKVQQGKIDIKTCTKEALLTLDFINDEQAEDIIQARDEGMMWRRYQDFAEQFNIMPHLWADVEEKIAFPLKKANRYGRTVDF